MWCRFADFIRNTDGAVTVDWVVLAAAVVGLGVTSVNVVRSGSNALAADIQTSLSDASVALICQGGTYQMRSYVGDAAGEALDIAREFSRYSDEELRAGFNDVSHKLDSLRAGGGSDADYDRNLDYLSILAAEMDSRGVTPDRGVPTFAEVAGLDASGCGAGGDGAASGPQLLALDEGQIAWYNEYLAGLRDDEVVAYFSEREETYYQAISNGDDEKARNVLDELNLISAALSERRDREREAAEAQARYERAYEHYQSTLR